MKKSKVDSELLKILVALALFFISFIFANNLAIRVFVLAISYSIVSYKTYFHAFHDIKDGVIFNESILMIIATIGAFILKEYPEAIMVMILYQIGEYLSDKSIDNSMIAITSLLDLSSRSIHLLKDGKISTIDVKKAKVGDTFVVKKGERIPLDGIIVDGYSTLDVSPLTGESKPKTVKPSYKVLSGSINTGAILTIKATAEFSNTTTTKIIELLENSDLKRSSTEKFINKFSHIYTPIVFVLALLLTIIPVVILGQEFEVWVYRSLELLVVSCPCALVISVPLAFFCGVGRASKEGILIKGNNVLDYLNNINAVVLDKTGTLTKGVFEVSKINSVNTISNTGILELAAHMEMYSTHPIAKSILQKYTGVIDEARVKEYEEMPGMGIVCKIDNEIYYLGNLDLLSKHNISPLKHGNEAGTIIYLANNEICLGYIVVSDVVKKEALGLKKELLKLGMKRLVMLSGDSEEVVAKVAEELGFREHYGELLPHQKVSKMKELKGIYNCAFVGDGINDAPVIKAADVGVAMGISGSDLSIESSDIVIMSDNLDDLLLAFKIAKYTKKIIIMNIAIALLAKFIIAILAVFGIANMWMAVLGDVGITVFAVLNSIRIFNKHFYK